MMFLVSSRISQGAARAAVFLMLLALASCKQHSPGAGVPAIEARDPWTVEQLVTPAALAAELVALKAKPAAEPMLLHVGFHVLYKGGAIPHSRYAGPGQTPEGIAGLQAMVKDVPKDQSIVIYCGCCPWDHCPNMRPAFAALKEMGFTHVRAVAITKNLDSDWAEKGYPIAKPVE
jgi:hypothetical protein